MKTRKKAATQAVLGTEAIAAEGTAVADGIEPPTTPVGSTGPLGFGGAPDKQQTSGGATCSSGSGSKVGFGHALLRLARLGRVVHRPKVSRAAIMRPRIAKSVAGQVLINIGLIFTVVAIIVGNMPDSGLTAALGKWTQPMLNVTGLQQDWGVFSPPPTTSAYVDARIDYSDGTFSVYSIPSRRGLAEYSDYRWQKYEESIGPDDGEAQWATYAQYLANRARADGRDPVRATLIRRWSDTLPPGAGPEHGPWHEDVMGVFPMGGQQ